MSGWFGNRIGRALAPVSLRRCRLAICPGPAPVTPDIKVTIGRPDGGRIGRKWPSTNCPESGRRTGL